MNVWLARNAATLTGYKVASETVASQLASNTAALGEAVGADMPIGVQLPSSTTTSTKAGTDSAAERDGLVQRCITRPRIN